MTGIFQAFKNLLALLLKGWEGIEQWKEAKQRAKEIDHAVDSARADDAIDDVLSKYPDRRKAGNGDSDKGKT